MTQTRPAYKPISIFEERIQHAQMGAQLRALLARARHWISTRRITPKARMISRRACARLLVRCVSVCACVVRRPFSQVPPAAFMD